MPAFDTRRFLADFAQALNSKDPTRFLAYYAPNAELTDPTTPEPVRGIDAVRKNFEQWAGSFGDVEFRVKELVQSGNKVAVLLDATGRHTGRLDLGPGAAIPATNKLVRFEIADFLTLDDAGKIVKDHSVFDLASMLQQIGASPGGR